MGANAMGIQERKKREKEGRRQQILTASKQLFAEHGFHQTTMEDIANAAELSPGTIYLYFKSKDELFAELSLGVIHYFNGRLEQITSREDVPPPRKLEVVKEILQDICTFDSFIPVNALKLQSVETLRKLSPRLINDLKKQTGTVARRLSDIFSEGIAAGYFINRSPEIFTGILWGIFSGMVLMNELQESFTDHAHNLPKDIENAFEVFSRGILKNA
jgi:AcrR family transcriptional regulator